ncbi:MAG TPA: SDR family NAD(P)-dependent oxidoreductase [Steroidobacteraceae bacterium]|nr:SDR family NAD(P)-dependent oxidoreductase [Steroidobacteraceae bacterium]
MEVTSAIAGRVAIVTGAGGAALAFAASVTDEAAIGAMVARTVTEWGRVDILVNNAGILRDKSFAKMTLADFRLVVDVHLMGSVICTQAVWDRMREQRHGRIVMTTSSSGLYGNFGQANYGAAKMALVGLMQTLAIEGEKYGIRVNCLAPSAATSMTQGVLPEASLKLLDPALVSPVLLALVGDDAPTRAIVCAGGGHIARAYVTLSQGRQVGGGEGEAERVIAEWEQISDRAGEIVPTYGFLQAEREVASAIAHAADT